ncbi:MAG: hypothetical protein KF841_13390 [Phycisphaerae bacterium]|nr:hypothetical protein [Phycisphaerae bacterium]
MWTTAITAFFMLPQVVALGLQAEIPPSHGRICSEPGEIVVSTLSIINETNCPVHIYLDDDFVGTCESFGTLKIRVHRVGEVVLLARSLCDTWGPVVRTLNPDQAAVWRITERGRQ